MRKPDPLVFFNGGPGLSTTAAAAHASWALDTLRHTRDLVLVDMRGTGNDAPLACDLYDDGGRIAPYVEPMFPIARVRECAGPASPPWRISRNTPPRPPLGISATRALPSTSSASTSMARRTEAASR